MNTVLSVVLELLVTVAGVALVVQGKLTGMLVAVGVCALLRIERKLASR